MAKSRIIKELANSEIDVITVLKRLKVLLSSFQNKKIADWVNSELNGYSSGAQIPEYRIICGQIKGSYIVGYMSYNNVPLPLDGLDAKTLNQLCTIKLSQSIGAIVEMLQSKQEWGQSSLPKINTYLNTYIMKNTNIASIVSSGVYFSYINLTHVTTTLENKILDILLYLEQQFGNLDEMDIDTGSKTDDDLKAIEAHITLIIYQDNRISIGDHNHIEDSDFINQREE